MIRKKYIQLESALRVLKFPYNLQSIGYVSNNPALTGFEYTFPNKIEINLRISPKSSSKQAHMMLAGARNTWSAIRMS